jgi:hypothetical protein
MGVTAGIFLASILLKEMRDLVYMHAIRYLYECTPKRYHNDLGLILVWFRASGKAKVYIINMAYIVPV